MLFGGSPGFPRDLQIGMYGFGDCCRAAKSRVGHLSKESSKILQKWHPNVFQIGTLVSSVWNVGPAHVYHTVHNRCYAYVNVSRFQNGSNWGPQKVDHRDPKIRSCSQMGVQGVTQAPQRCFCWCLAGVKLRVLQG